MTLKEQVYLLDQLWVCLLSFIRSHWFLFILLNKTAKQLLFLFFLCSRQLPATPFLVGWLLCYKSLMFFCKCPLKKYHTRAPPASRKKEKTSEFSLVAFASFFPSRTGAAYLLSRDVDSDEKEKMHRFHLKTIKPEPNHPNYTIYFTEINTTWHFVFHLYRSIGETFLPVGLVNTILWMLYQMY